MNSNIFLSLLIYLFLYNFSQSLRIKSLSRTLSAETSGASLLFSKKKLKFSEIPGKNYKIKNIYSYFFLAHVEIQLNLPKFNNFELNEHNDELFTNSRYEPDAIKDENEFRQHVYEFNEEEGEETHLTEKEKMENSDYKDYEK